MKLVGCNSEQGEFIGNAPDAQKKILELRQACLQELKPISDKELLRLTLDMLSTANQWLKNVFCKKVQKEHGTEGKVYVESLIEKGGLDNG